MNDEQERRLAVLIFRQAVQNAPEPNEPHLVDDDELLACWSAGSLSESQQAAFTDHLARCERCRRELALLIRNEVLELPEERVAPTDDADIVAIPAVSAERISNGENVRTPLRGRFADRPRFWATMALLATAASLLIAVTWRLTPTRESGLLALAERQIRDGHAESARKTLEPLLVVNAEPASRDRAKTLWEESAYREGAQRLEAGGFDQVRALEQEAARLGLDSARLANLDLQATRKIPHETTLASAGTLPDYGFDLDGKQRRKAIPVFDAESQRVYDALKKAVADHPDSVTLRLNLGQLLLERQQTPQAAAEFERVLQLDPENASALLGLGLADCEAGRFDEALERFQSILRTTRNDLQGLINAAVCFERLGRGDEAKQFWERALPLIRDENLRRAVETRLSQTRR